MSTVEAGSEEVCTHAKVELASTCHQVSSSHIGNVVQSHVSMQVQTVTSVLCMQRLARTATFAEGDTQLPDQAAAGQSASGQTPDEPSLAFGRACDDGWGNMEGVNNGGDGGTPAGQGSQVGGDAAMAATDTARLKHWLRQNAVLAADEVGPTIVRGCIARAGGVA